MAIKKKILKNILKKRINLPKIKVPSVNLLEDTKNKINDYYTNFKKDREKKKDVPKKEKF